MALLRLVLVLVLVLVLLLLLLLSTGTFKVKAGLAQMAKGGIIMDVTTAEEAVIAEEAGVSTNLSEATVEQYIC